MDRDRLCDEIKTQVSPSVVKNTDMRNIDRHDTIPCVDVPCNVYSSCDAVLSEMVQYFHYMVEKVLTKRGKRWIYSGCSMDGFRLPLDAFIAMAQEYAIVENHSASVVEILKTTERFDSSHSFQTARPRVLLPFVLMFRYAERLSPAVLSLLLTKLHAIQDKVPIVVILVTSSSCALPLYTVSKQVQSLVTLHIHTSASVWDLFDNVIGSTVANRCGGTSS